MLKTQNILGILGLGNRSTLFYIDTLNTAYNNEEKAYSTFPFLLYNTDFNEINPYLPDNFKKLLPTLSECFNQLERLPISHLLVPNITLHEAIDKLKTPFPILHPLALSLNYLKENKKEQVVIFGSKYTMTSRYISNYLAKEDIEATSPSKKDMEFIDNLRTKIYSNSETPSEIEAYNMLVKKYSRNALVMIACTELSILKSSIDVLDLTCLQVEKALKLHKN
ncbi:hypothetical protein OS188_09370 [Xanthomarina sp. F1114]|uniref:aspartate/glutamate racemase family protein n=1 Tax=Xanthomarina sp. F1114 TaxID=2996019 RepID=UPI00225E5107|nr:aspartate/glutamate racemase family protein [Xanthomarina sp. F1114]MCX7548162.1 hypothetical protein [Xanthomarina sp. F1114]